MGCSQDLKISSSASEAVECRNLFFVVFLVGWGEGSFRMYVNNSNHCVFLCFGTLQYGPSHQYQAKASL